MYVNEGEECCGGWVFSDFEKARENMKKLIHAYANTPNRIFDGQGMCTDFEEYMAERELWDNYLNPIDDEVNDEFHRMWVDRRGGYDDSAKCFWKAAKLPELLKTYLNDMDNFSPETIPEGTWTDYLIGCKFSPDEIYIQGVDDGPCNGIDPFFLINTFNIDSPEKEYSFRIRSCFGENCDYIFIDVIPVELDEEINFPLK